MQEPFIIRTSERKDFKLPERLPDGRLPGNRRTPEEQALAIRLTNQRARLMYRYGITPEQFNERYDEQGGCCGICAKPFTKRPHIDHDHETNRFRGLLCLRCNTSLELIESYREAIDAYLK